MRPTKGRVRVLSALSKPGMYAHACGHIPGSLHRMPGGVEAVLIGNGMIEYATDVPHLVRVFRITQKGRAWIAKHDPEATETFHQPTETNEQRKG